MKQALSLPLAAALLLAAPASAQVDVSDNVHGGIPWAVAAPRGASWTLACRFAPVTVDGVMFNAINETGRGARQGRLPGRSGRCTVTKTGGAGGVGVSIVKDGVATTAGTATVGASVMADVF